MSIPCPNEFRCICFLEDSHTGKIKFTRQANCEYCCQLCELRDTKEKNLNLHRKGKAIDSLCAPLLKIWF